MARIGSIVDYPNGSALTSVRVAEVRALVDAGVDELDATVNVGYLLSGRIAEFAADLAAVVAAAEPIGVKLMLELPLLTARQREHAVQAAIDAGAAFVAIASRGSVGIADPATIGSMNALNGVCRAPEHVFLAQGVSREAAGAYAVAEAITNIRWVPWPEVLRMVETSEITDGETLAALLHAAIALGKFS